MVRDLVLLGCGHSHVAVLRAFGERPIPGVRLTLVTRERQAPYSGMLPGVVAGHYAPQDSQIDSVALARFAGARLLHDEAVGIDLTGRSVRVQGGAALQYDLLSVNIGSRPGADVPGAPGHVIPVKPIDGFLTQFDALRARVLAGQSRRILMVGGGAGGVELLLSVERRLRRDAAAAGLDPAQLDFALVTGAPMILPEFPRAFRARFATVFAARGITIHADTMVTGVTKQGIAAGHRTIPADEVLWTTAAAAATWLSTTGLALDPSGFVQVDACLRAAGRDDVFAAGDTVAFGPRPIPRSGVYAVRAGPVLADNLRATLTGRRLRPYRPQRAVLYIVSTGEKYGVATRNGLTVGGRWAWWLKDRIDRGFIRRFTGLAH
ncbi:MAG: FAD-dependent oxidoreductase [Gemmatimonadaceae bacterium]|nr:FAD-dependent oxidoreductase [Acetobacteraceae bacterium]